MAWLLRRGEVLASVELVSSPIGRVRGLRHRADDAGALLVTPSRTAHSFGLRYPIDLAYLDRDLVVLSTTTIGQNRLARLCFGARSVLEVRAGAFERWGLSPGDCLEIRD